MSDLADMGDEIAGLLMSTSTPGAQVAWSGADARIHECAFGTLGALNPRPTATTTRFQACSISKSIAVTAAVRLCEDGVLDLDEDVAAYLSGWVPTTPEGERVPVTVRQLASHTAGMNVGSLAGYPRGVVAPTVRDILDGRRALNDPVRQVLPPGSFAYSGGGTTIIQAVLEEVTGTSFAEVARELVLTPGGMLHSSADFAVDDGEHAYGHRAGGTVPGGWRCHPERAAAGLWTTAGDLVRWASAISAAWRGDPSFVGTAAAHTMLGAVASTGGTPWLGRLDAAGVGVFVRSDTTDGHIFGHTGSNDGYRSHVVADADTGHCVAIVANSDNSPPLLERVVEAAGLG